MNVQIGIDLMGGDHSPLVIWEVLIDVLNSRASNSHISFIAFASHEVKEQILSHSTYKGYPEVISSESFIILLLLCPLP